MNDLISRKALLAEYDRTHVGEPGNARKLIEDAPVVDAAPVVRCNKCKFWSDGVPGCTDHVKVCTLGFYMVGENGFCVFGERKDQ